ncbi:glycerate kinase family protein [Pengzhenrongella sicca]|uniref:Glycerate kinase n=1 Tax=Pengzhenrongella sicca TaxID=2819238 RepID=A0A8A4ZD27_9MICO|nr:glycerate kinase [Pengzhenrongella sicca]QTE28387.1 glycerate kinase [Pengzhenrongella sicca]
MRVVIAPDCFGGTLTAEQAAAAISAGWLRAAPRDVLDVRPLADGGPGFVETLRASLGGELLVATVRPPTPDVGAGDAVPAAVLVVEGADGTRTAYLESAQAAGLALVPPALRDPTRTSTYGVGELLRAALATGAGRVVVGLGGSATNDAGAGMLAALGVGASDGPLARGGGGLGAVTAADLAGLAELRASLAGVELLVATDVDVPLLGLHGASAGFAPQKGATDQQAQDLERALGSFAHAAVAALGPDAVRPDLLASSRSASAAARLTGLPGAGAAGGLGFGLALLGARIVSGSGLVADAVGLPARIGAADVVVTGEGTFDWQSLHGKVVAAVAERALAAGVPAIVLAGQVQVGRREWSAAGIAGAYAVAETAEQVAAAFADPAGTLAARAERVARTWSPARRA